MSKKERTLKVEAQTFSEYFEIAVDRHFRGQPVHRVEDSGAYRVKEMVQRFRDKLIRSRQEHLLTPSGMSTQLQWASLCFRLEEDVFAVVLAKGDSGFRSRNGADDYKVTVVASAPEKAA